MDAQVPPLTDVPSTSLVLPSAGSTLTGTKYVDAIAADPVGVTGVKFPLFGGTYFCCPSGLHAHPDALRMVVPLEHHDRSEWFILPGLKVSNSGGSAFSSAVGITVNNPASTNVLVPSSGATLSGSRYLDASASNATSVEFVLFGGTYGLSGYLVGTATLTIYGWLDNWNTTTVPNGSYVLLSYASGPGGSTASSAVSVTVNN